jgi:hypothetical protein
VGAVVVVNAMNHIRSNWKGGFEKNKRRIKEE